MTADQAMTAEQAATLKRLAKAAYELDAFKPNLTHAEADLRIAVVTAKRRHPAVSARVARVQSKATAIASILPATFWLGCSSKRTR